MFRSGTAVGAAVLEQGVQKSLYLGILRRRRYIRYIISRATLLVCFAHVRAGCIKTMFQDTGSSRLHVDVSRFWKTQPTTLLGKTVA